MSMPPKCTEMAQTGFTLIELLAVVFVVAVLSVLSLPALSSAKTRAKNVQCRNNLRQVGLALAMYTETSSGFPPVYSQVIPDASTYLGWDHLLQPYLSQRQAPGLVSGAPQLPSTASAFFLCPFFGTRLPGVGFIARGPMYGYNALGVGWNGVESFGLDGFSSESMSGKIRESDIVRPCEMIALGDPFVRAEAEQQDPVFQYAYGWHPVPAAAQLSPQLIARGSRAVQIHGRIFNRAFVDGHCESEDFNRRFLASDDYLRRWNRDYEPHRESWITVGGGL